MTPEEYLDLKQFVIDSGFEHEINYYQDIPECNTALVFAYEAIWVICNSGMKNQVARKIYDRILQAIIDGEPVSSAFNHRGKVNAIEEIYYYKDTLFEQYINTSYENKLKFLAGLPYVGQTTKYHLAKNLGMDVCKPDRHLMIM